MTGELNGARRSIRMHLIVGLSLMLVLAGGFGGWASTAQISGALIAPGSVVVDSNVKKVQHPTGGVVGEVRVRDGDIVKAGDIVVRLDETVVKAGLAIVVKTLNGLWARAARLEAEQRGLDQIKFPPMLTDRADDPDVRDIMASETKLFEVRVFGRAGQKSQLRERVSQLNEEIAGLTAQEQAKDKEIVLVEKELVGVRQLYEQRLIQISRLTVLERDRPACRASARNTSPRARRPRARSPKPNCRSSRSTRTWSARSPRICARPTTRSASSSSARSPPRISSAASTSARRRTASCCSRRFTPSAA